MARTKAEDRAIKKYEAEKIDKPLLRLPKGRKAIITEHAIRHGESTNGFIVRAINEAIENDEKKEC